MKYLFHLKLFIYALIIVLINLLFIKTMFKPLQKHGLRTILKHLMIWKTTIKNEII